MLGNRFAGFFVLDVNNLLLVDLDPEFGLDLLNNFVIQHLFLGLAHIHIDRQQAFSLLDL